jgi:hypothetical protein
MHVAVLGYLNAQSSSILFKGVPFIVDSSQRRNRAHGEWSSFDLNISIPWYRNSYTTFALLTESIIGHLHSCREGPNSSVAKLPPMQNASLHSSVGMPQSALHLLLHKSLLHRGQGNFSDY